MFFFKKVVDLEIHYSFVTRIDVRSVKCQFSDKLTHLITEL